MIILGRFRVGHDQNIFFRYGGMGLNTHHKHGIIGAILKDLQEFP